MVVRGGRRRRNSRWGAGLLVVASVLVAPVAAQADSPGCAGGAATVVLRPGTPVADYAENLGYDAHGGLWVSRLYRNMVQRYDARGRLTATVPVDSPGAIRLGPDGRMYVVSGDSSVNLVPGAHGGSVVRFAPDAVQPRPETFTAGLGMPNGAAFDRAGNLYVADTARGVIRIRPDGTIDSAWTAAASRVGPGVNGIVVDGGIVYATAYFDAAGALVGIPIDDPAAFRTIARVTGPSGISALPDDLAVGPDGQLYDATTTGSLMRVDRARHTVCTVYSGTDPLTAVAAALDRSLLVSTGTGVVLRIMPGGR